jgi:hypothetical protein
MDIHCLPIARSDETLYSVVARIRLANAARNDIDACQSLFGHSRNTRVSDFPVNLKRFCDVTQDCFGDPARVLADMTLSGFFERLGSRPWNSGSAPAPIITAGYGLSTLSNGSAGRWRVCLRCVESDLRCHATAFWRRAHHLPTAFVCPIHATPLASCMLAPLERHKRFLLPEQIEAAPLKAYVDWAAHYHTLNRLTVLGMDVLKDTRQSIDADTVHATLLNALDNHGLLTATGMLRRVPFSSEFVHRYQFLSGHRDFTPALSPQGIAILQRSFIHPAPPRSAIHNLLLVDWLSAPGKHFISIATGKRRWTAHHLNRHGTLRRQRHKHTGEDAWNFWIQMAKQRVAVLPGLHRLRFAGCCALTKPGSMPLCLFG